MSIKSGEGVLPPIKKEWLYPEEAFIRYCNFDAYGKAKLPRQIDSNFLRALEKDGFMKPLLAEPEAKVVRNEAGKSPEVLEYEKTPTNFYSPFQVFVVAVLVDNEVDEAGYLRSSKDLDWQKERGVRTIATGWGGGGFTNASASGGKMERRWRDPVFGLPLPPEDFHNFLRLLHSFNAIRKLGHARTAYQRYHREYPSLQYDFKLLEQGGKQLVKQFGLSEARLEGLRRNLGQFTTDIDPLENWYYYLEKHPQWRKDRLKGPAFLAQDLYRLCDLVTEVLEKVTGKSQKPLLEFLYPDFKPMDMAGIEYLRGQDAKAMGKALKKLKDWLSKAENKNLAERVIGNVPELRKLELLDGPSISQAMREVGEGIVDFVKRYGERYYQDNVIREVKGEEELTLEDLDDETKKRVESVIAAYKNKREGRNGRSYLVLSSTSIMERHVKHEISEDEAIRLDREQRQKEEIAAAIEYRLRRIQVRFHRIVFAISEGLRQEKERLEEELKAAEQESWGRFRTTAPKQHKQGEDGKSVVTQVYVEAFEKFRSGKLERDTQPYRVETEEIKVKEQELGEINWFAGLVLCAVCRKEPVQLHYGFGDKQVSFSQICDGCFTRIDAEVLDLDEEGWKNLKEGEWRCECGTVLYKFAHRNTIGLWAVGKQPIKVGINYGKATLEAKCRKCGKVSRREIDWGWAP